MIRTIDDVFTGVSGARVLGVYVDDFSAVNSPWRDVAVVIDVGISLIGGSRWVLRRKWKLHVRSSYSVSQRVSW